MWYKELSSLNLFSPTILDITIPIAVALLCGIMIAWLYRITYQGPGFSQNFTSSIILLPMITALVIMVIGNNLARAFGLVGALSIIRFRTALKEPLDIVYVFFALAIGMASGIGSYSIACAGTLIIGTTLAVLARSRNWTPSRREYLLQFIYTPDEEMPPLYQKVLEKYCRRFEAINVKSAQNQSLLEISFYIDIKDKDDCNAIVQALQKVNGVEHINLFYDDQTVY
jgi:uncharacterized membrane protein YhiD involved in acid resistance